MLLDNKQVGIIGGGPGGLILARLLQQKGANVKVYERDVNKDVRVQGATLDLHFESGLKAIEAAGLTEVFKESYRPGADLGRVVDIHGNIIYDEHAKVYDKTFGDEEFRPEIDRADLRDVLLNSLLPDTVIWDSQFKTIGQENGKWKLEFKNGVIVTADFVIGADGANSKVRPFVTDIKPAYAGIIIFQGNIPCSENTAPNIHQLLKGGKIYTHVNDKYLHISAKGDGSTDFYICCRLEENYIQNSGINFEDRKQLIEWFKKEFPKRNEIWLELFENVSLPLLLRPQYCMPFDQAWEPQSNITLLGDAAHLMPPSGEGVNLAMLDALELAECLTGLDFKDSRAAIAAYEKQMQERAIAEAKVSMDGVSWMLTEGANEKLVQLFTDMP